MAVYEPKAHKNGIPVPIQYIFLQSPRSLREPILHYHEYTEILFGVSGTGTVHVGSNSFTLTPGSMMIIRSDDPHEVIPHDEQNAWHVVKFMPQILLSDEQTSSEYGYVLLLMEQLGGKQMFFPADELVSTELSTLFWHLKQEWEEESFGYELSLRADVTRIFLYILRQWISKNPLLSENASLSTQSELIRRAIAYVRQNFAEITEEETALACGVSSAYLSRVFKRCMKRSFSAYVNDIRLREASRLLLKTDDSVTDIAQAVGFSTSAYFIAKFRELHKITPHRYRTLHRERG